MELPKITIVTPSYNQGQFLEQTIRSVVEQDYPNFEYIVMDGGSTDNSVEIIKKYEDKITCWQSQKDKGQSDAIAKGFDMATGDILGWINSDDFLLPGALKAIGRTFENNSDLALMAGACVHVDQEGVPFRVSIPKTNSAKGLVFWGTGFAQQSTFWSKKAYEKAGGIDISMHFSFDFDLVVRIRSVGTMVAIPDYLSAFRFHETQKTAVFAKKMVDESRLTIQRYSNLGQRGLRIRGFIHRYNLWRRFKNIYAFHKNKAKLQILCKFGL